MDPLGKKRAQTTTPDSDATPPSKRRQLSSVAVGSPDQQSAAASAHQAAVAAAVAVSSAAPAAAAPPTSASPAVSAANRLSPAQRCPSDPLSVAFSFLNTRDFAATIRVCRHWQRACELQSAWPEFSIERLISGLIEDEDHWTQSRSVRVSADQLSAGALEQAMQSRKWRRLAELYLFSFFESEEMVSLSRAAQLPHLQSLRLSCVPLADVAAGFGSMASRLLALKCEGLENELAIQPHLHLLVNLRVLTLHQHDEIDARALLPLHRLEYLQLHYVYSVDRDLLLAIRRLSVQHRLRHLSLTSNTSPALDLDPLVAELSGAESGLAPAALGSIRLRCVPANAPSSALLSLPNLTQLHWTGRESIGTSDQHGHSLPPSPLQKLRLNWQSSDVVALARLLQRVAARAPQLQELSLGFRRLPEGPESLQRLRSLRVLEVSVCPLPLSLVRTLVALPLFSELIVRQGKKDQENLELTSCMLRAIAESRSWRLIRLIGRCEQLLFTLPNDVDARLAERLAHFRVQSEWDHVISHRLAIGADGTAMWQQTPI